MSWTDVLWEGACPAPSVEVAYCVKSCTSCTVVGCLVYGKLYLNRFKFSHDSVCELPTWMTGETILLQEGVS